MRAVGFVSRFAGRVRRRGARVVALGAAAFSALTGLGAGTDALDVESIHWDGSAETNWVGGSLVLSWTNAAAVGTLTLDKPAEVWMLVVAGGGAGGYGAGGQNPRGGGGGAGGMLESIRTSLAAGTYAVTVGAGGGYLWTSPNMVPQNGKDSSIVGGDIAFTAVGGGAGGYWSQEPPKAGGSGGGGAGKPGASGVDGQGNAGGTGSNEAGGGGGGAGAPGGSNAQGSAGGAGRASTITGTTVVYAGGGAGAACETGGSEGGGGAKNQPGVNGLGGGGGASTAGANQKLVGGSGIVVVRFLVGGMAPVPVPSAVPGLVYDGREQVGVRAGTGVRVTDGAATEAGDYTAKASLEDGFIWDDGGDGVREIPWSIRQAENDWTVPPSISKPSWGQNERPGTVTAGTPKFGQVAVSISFNGGASVPLEGDLPNEIGDYVLTFAVEGTTNYAGLSTDVGFSVTAARWDEDATRRIRKTGGELRTLGDDVVVVYTNFAANAENSLEVLGDTEAWVLCVAGGGCGGYGAAGQKPRGGGGGAGGLVEETALRLMPGTYRITVGAGGVCSGNIPQNGKDSVIACSGDEVIRAFGGGAGGYWSQELPTAGGSGGGGAGKPGASGVAGQGHAGGTGSTDVGGGGGGAGAAGGSFEQGGTGGAGLASSITGVSVVYAGGGAGAACATGSEGGGGAKDQPGVNGLGGGGGAATGGAAGAKRGGSGIVVVRYTKTADEKDAALPLVVWRGVKADGETAVTVDGCLWDFGAGADGATVYIDYTIDVTGETTTFMRSMSAPGELATRIGGLKAGRTYTFAMHVVNSKGVSRQLDQTFTVTMPGGKTTWGDYSASQDAESPLQVTFAAALGYMGVNESVVTFRYRQDGAAEWTEKPLGTYSRTSRPTGPFVENVVFRSTRPVSYEFVVTNGDGEMTWTDRVAGRIELNSKTQTESYWANKKLAIEPTVTQTKTITQSKTKVTRSCDFYTHGQDPAWGGTYAGTDTFILARPTDGDQAKRPLIIFLHGRGSTHETLLNDFRNEDGVYSAPDDFYCMFMDCSRGWKAVDGGPQPGEDYWWGARASFKGPEMGDVPGLRRERPAALRVLDCIEWIVREKGIDRNRIYIAGNSMGAQGALAIGLPHGEVFAAIEANVPATVWYASARMNFVGDDGFLRAAEERDGTLYNDPPPVLDWSGSNDVWSRNHEVLIEAMNRFRYAYTFLWGAYGHVSSYATAQQYNELVGRIDWKRIVKNAAYPVFSNTTGNNVLPWPWLSYNYAINNYSVWAGDIQQIGTGPDKTRVTYRADAEMDGQLNGFLRYANVSDDATGVGMQLWVATAEEAGATKPAAPASVTADVTLRRVQGFKLMPRQPCAWSFGDASGVARADREGLVTLRLALDNERRELRLEPLPMDELVVTPTLAKRLPDAIQFAVDVIATGAAGGDSADVAVKFRPEGGAEWTSRPLGRLSGSTLQTVDGLMPGQAYEFRFTAENGDERTETDLGRIATVYEALSATAAVAGIGETDVTLALTLESLGTLAESAAVTAFLREENALEWRTVELDPLTAPGAAERLVGGLAAASRYALKVRIANGVDPDVEIDLGKVLTGGAGGKRLVEVPMVRDLFWTGGTQRPAVDATDDYFVSRNDGGVDVDTYTVELTLRDPDSTRWTGSDSATFAVQYRIIARIPGLNTYPGVETYSCKGDVFMVFREGTDVEFDLAFDAQADVLLVGGGGPGGMATTWSAGGAGAGGGAGGMVLSEKTSLRAGSYRVTVGEGGEPRTDHGQMNGRGGDSSLTGAGVSLLAFGGGGGGHASTAQNQQIAARGVKGGSSGGSLQYNNMYGGTPSIDGGVVRTWCKAGQGNPGGRVGSWKPNPESGEYAIFTSSSGGGGAGAAAAGVADDNTFLPGGAGKACDITGESVVYAGGGAGGAYATADASCTVAASAGGGAGAAASAGGLVSGDGADGLGGGGAGGSYYAGTLCAPGRGGRGVVIVRLREFTAANCMHSDVVTVTKHVAPTCDAVGYTAEKFCNGCRRTVCRRVELPKLSHEYVHDDARDGDFCRHCGAESHFSQIDRILRCGDRRYVFLIAHRGLTNDTLRIPENSAASIVYAGDEGVDVVEIDPKSTADGVIILSHDMTMSRQVYGTAPEGKVGDSPTLYWDDLEDCILRVSDSVNEPSGHRICRFEEALDAAKDRCMLSLDFDFWTIGGGAQLEKLWALVCEKGMQRQCLFFPSHFGDHPWRSNPPAGMRLSTDLDSTVSLNQNQPLGYSDRASLAHPERIGWQRRFDEGYQGTLSDNCLQMKPYLESIGRRNLEVETDTRRRVKPLIPGNRTFVRGSEIRYGARDTADYIVVNDSGEGGDPERGEFFFTLRLRDPETTRWADTSDGDKKMWYFADFADPAIASALPTDYADRDGVASYRGTDAIEGLSWTGARRAYALGDETVLVFADVRSAELGFTVADGYYATGRCLLVGGGGPGGKGGTYTWKVSNVDTTKDLAGAGGGAGGMLETELARLESGAYDVTVGAGGAVGSSSSKPNNCGGNSLIVGGALRLEAIGGGGGGHSVTAISDKTGGSAGVMGGSSGGSLLGVDEWGAGLSGIDPSVWQNLCVAGQGNPGGRIGGYCSGFVPCSTVGGGGAATNLNALTGFTAGTGAKFDFDYNPGKEKYDAPDNSFTGGGAGRVSDITGEDVVYAGGGAGGALFASRQVPVAGGVGGGGSVDFATRQVAARGVNMLGGGGAGGSIRKNYISTPGEGGDGVVVVRVRVVPSGSCVHAHKSVTKEAKAATCTEDGWTEEVSCDDCHVVVTPSQPIGKLGHDYKETGRQEPTATVPGWILYECQREGCDSSYTEVIPVPKPREGQLPTEMPEGATAVASGAVDGIAWTGAEKAWRIGDETVLVFTDVANAGTFTVAAGKTATVSYLAVGGGGAGGTGLLLGEGWNPYCGGGGGAGGLDYGAGQALAAGDYAIQVGAGGAVSTKEGVKGGNGGDSLMANGAGGEIFKAVGGGAGGTGSDADFAGTDGGCGGGGSGSTAHQPGVGGVGTQSCDGGSGAFGSDTVYGGGGGGAGADGHDAAITATLWIGGDGGDGLASAITGLDVWYAGGGAGGSVGYFGKDSPKETKGGAGGGGKALVSAQGSVAEAGVDTLGGGGAGAVYTSLNDGAYVMTQAGRGGNGVVVIRVTKVTGGGGILIGPGGESEPYDTREAAETDLPNAVLVPRTEVAKVFEGNPDALADYKAKFGFVVAPTAEGKWVIAAELTSGAQEELLDSADKATRQIPLTQIAALQEGDDPVAATVTDCVPGFYYTLYDGIEVTAIQADDNPNNVNVLCGANGTVTFPEVEKPSPEKGFFSVGAGETPRN